MSFVGFSESVSDVIRNMESGTQGLPPELQQLATKGNGMKLTMSKKLYYCF